MARKIMQWKTRGMNQDLSVSAFNNEFAFENVNLRLSTNENNTLMSWVNEKGTAPMKETGENNSTINVSFVGTPIGTAVINHQLIVFTHFSETVNNTISKKDYIYLLSFKNRDTLLMEKDILFEGNLNFDTQHPLETMVSYEATNIQKVYWTDNKNQPRLINIANREKLNEWQTTYNTSYFPNVATFFDFVPAVVLSESHIQVSKNPSGGYFAPGVIQYCFTYFNKNGQQSNVVEASPLFYLAYSDRAASPEDTNVSCSFTITIDNIDKNFDYIRLYSIQRTSLNTTPVVKIVEDLLIEDIPSNESVTYIDNGVVGSQVDPFELIYVGGKEITALTMTDKDNTLFMGNLKEINLSPVVSIQEYFKGIVTSEGVSTLVTYSNTPEQGMNIKTSTISPVTGFYGHDNTLLKSQPEITTFKGGETYRFGFQLQKYTGEWSEPIWIGDKENTLYPNTGLYQDTNNLVYAKGTIPLKDGQNNSIIDTSVYKRIRPVIVYPTIADRTVLCQGVLNPTVFNASDRVDNSPFAQASWYFRPYMVNKYKVAPSDSALGINVVKSAISQDMDISIDSNFSDADDNEGCYVYVMHGKKDLIQRILKEGVIHFYFVDEDDYTSKAFDGAILLGEEDGTDYADYAFISSTQWTNVATRINLTQDTSTGSPGCSRYHYGTGTGREEVDGSSTPIEFHIYNKLRVTNNQFYFSTPNEDITTYTFKFYGGYHEDHRNYYQVVFTTRGSIADNSHTTIDGRDIPFEHYEELVTENSIVDILKVEGEDTKYKWDLDKAKSIEIQGSSRIYSHVYDAAKEKSIWTDKTVGANNQFFVDQSIITLNSPDLEFDTEVQRHSTEDLMLRVIGVIPITGGASSHAISAGAMLEADHNKNSSAEGFESIQFGAGEKDYNVLYSNIDPLAGNRLVAEYLWNDVKVIKHKTNTDYPDGIETSADFYNYLVYPWHRESSLNDDSRPKDSASSWMNTKKESNMLYSFNTEYFKNVNVASIEYPRIKAKIALTENAEVINYKLGTQNTELSSINYYPNIDKLLYNVSGYKVLSDNLEGMGDDGYWEADGYPTSTSPVYMRYKSTTHAAIALCTRNGVHLTHTIPLMPYAKEGTQDIGVYDLPFHFNRPFKTFWGDLIQFEQQSYIDMADFFKQDNAHVKHNFLWLGELCKKNVPMRFGGTSDSALRSNTWLPCGDAVLLEGSSVPLYWTVGDTYYQRYDCLKTYPFTNEDPNQLVEILSFMCETRVNIDGRYDKFRGQKENHLMNPTIFNRVNMAYSQQDNYFFGKKTTQDEDTSLEYPNQIWYSETKNSGADVDLWTKVTLASMLELDGNKGEISSLRRLNDQILAFQDTGIAQVLYNENVQIASTAGVPIEIANSGKVQGARYLSDTVGCSNKWSIVNTPAGIYFMDSIGKHIWVFNGQLNNLSGTLGFNTWSKGNIPPNDVEWTPDDFENFVSYYDKQNQDILFINKNTALAYSEKLSAFTSFYDYGHAPYFCNLDDIGLWVYGNGNNYGLYGHQKGAYGNFFGTIKPYSMKLVGNPEPMTDKIFTNLEFRATIESTLSPSPLPFDTLEVDNEYQSGIAYLQHKNGIESMQHHLSDETATLKRKFRIWRCDIPRDNRSTPPHPLSRMRNPWIYLKLQKNAESSLNRVEIHDMLMTYFN